MKLPILKMRTNEYNTFKKHENNFSYNNKYLLLNLWAVTMNKYFILSILCFIIGFFLLGLGISQGQGKIYWAVIFTIFEGAAIFSFLGLMLIILGIIFLMLGLSGGTVELVGLNEMFGDEDRIYPHPIPHHYGPGYKRGRKPIHKPKSKYGQSPAQDYPAEPRTRVKTGGVVFIGPIPIIWGSDKNIAYIMALVALIIVIIVAIFIFAWLL